MLNKQIPVITELQDRSALYDGYQTVGKVHLSAPDIMTIEKIKPSPSGNDAKYDLVDLGRLPAEVSDLSGLFRQLGGMAGAADSTILFSVPNALSLDYLSGQYFIDTVGKTERRMTYSGICRFLAENGYEITAVAAEEKSTGSFQQLRIQSEKTASDLAYFSSLFDGFQEAELFHIYCTMKAEDKEVRLPDAEKPLISVIIRTVGDRLSELQEVFLCLSCQEFQNFEVLLMLHNVSDERYADIQKLISQLPEEDREKIRVIPVSGGNRSTPLNAGIAHAHGSYFVALDDDDIVMANWLQVFAEKIETASGTIIHSYAVSQEWSRNGACLHSEGDRDGYFCADFDWNRQYVINRCPLMTLAFPLYTVRHFHFCFNEQYDTTEDWDFLMRVASVAGVTDAPFCTAVYRKWKNAASSTTLYTSDEWRKTEKEIRADFRSMKRIVNASEYMKDLSDDEESSIALEPELYLNGKKIHADTITMNGMTTKVLFSLVDVPETNGKMRIDPSDHGGYRMIHPVIRVRKAGNIVEQFERSAISTNGVWKGNELIFYLGDPQMHVCVTENHADTIEVSFIKQYGMQPREALTMVPRAYVKLLKEALGYILQKFRRK